MLGLEVGSNKQLIAALPTLGVEAMVLSVSATLGSCVLAWALDLNQPQSCLPATQVWL
jgi:hypothetical protein